MAQPPRPHLLRPPHRMSPAVTPAGHLRPAAGPQLGFEASLLASPPFRLGTAALPCSPLPCSATRPVGGSSGVPSSRHLEGGDLQLMALVGLSLGPAQFLCSAVPNARSFAAWGQGPSPCHRGHL